MRAAFLVALILLAGPAFARFLPTLMKAALAAAPVGVPLINVFRVR
jgi:hypothetical protein